jgi:hypothetical protein
MYHPTPTGLALRMGMLLVMSILLLVPACGAPEEAKPRPLPEDTRKLGPGTYRSEEFEPSFSFKVGKGWTNLPPEMPDNLALVWGQTGFLRFFKAQEVSKPTERYEVVDAPKDLVGWLRRHPHLRTSTPEPVEVGGIKGERLDVVVGDLPEDHVGACGPDCVDLFRLSDGSALGAGKGFKYRAIVLEDVKGETVIIGFGGPAGEFDEFVPEAHKVLDGVQWRGE